MAFYDGLLPLNGWGEDGRTIGRVLVYRLCKKGHELGEIAQAASTRRHTLPEITAREFVC